MVADGAANGGGASPPADFSSKRKGRRRKAFNRTGFPSVKKKKKKKKLSTSALDTSNQSEWSARDECTPASRAAPNSGHDESASKKPRLDKEALRDRPTAVTATDNTRSADSGDDSPPAPPAPATAPAAVAPEPKKRRVPCFKKRYLTAGLFSNFFKDVASSASSRLLTYDPDEHEHGLLPPPFHCEKWLRRRRQDFQLPFDLWWLHQHGKLPGRDAMVPSWNYRKIRSNVYYDVKPPFTNDAQACNCIPPPPDQAGTNLKPDQDLRIRF